MHGVAQVQAQRRELQAREAEGPRPDQAAHALLNEQLEEARQETARMQSSLREQAAQAQEQASVWSRYMHARITTLEALRVSSI